jgi:hypothetical protein
MGLFEGLMGLGGSIIGNGFASMDEAKEHNEYNDMLDQIRLLNPDKVRELQAEQAGRSDMNNIRTDPRLREAQMKALNSMQGVYAGGGMDAQGQAQLNDINNNVAQQDKARRDAIVSQAARKGHGTGGAQYAALLSGAQGAAQAQANAGFGAHAAAQQRALQAMSQGGQMAGDMRGQDFGEQSAVAGANDKINQFNTQLRQQANIQNQQRDQQVVGNNFKKTDLGNDVRDKRAQMFQRRAQGNRDRGYGYGKAAGAVVDSMIGQYGGGG